MTLLPPDVRASLQHWAVQLVVNERERQDKLWGGPENIVNESPDKALLVLLEEIGEAAKAHLERRPREYREEMVHVCAVALAAIEASLAAG